MVCSIDERVRCDPTESRKIIDVVMPGLVPGIHVFLSTVGQDVDGRDKPGHDE